MSKKDSSKLSPGIQDRVKETTTHAMALPISSLRCPACEFQFEENSENLDEAVTCPACQLEFAYVDGYLNNYKAFIEIFINEVHPIPLVPGYSVGGEVSIEPGKMTIVPYGVEYVRPPEVFFLEHGGGAVKELQRENLLLFPLTVNNGNAILFSHQMDSNALVQTEKVMWIAIGEMGVWDKPLWLNYLQNSADLVRKGEDVAAVVMLLIALDFYYDDFLLRFGIDYDQIRKMGRRPGMNEKKAKLKMISDRVGDWPVSFSEKLRDLTDYRNKIVHGVVKRPTVQVYTGRRAFQVVMRAIMFLIEMYYRAESNKEQTGIDPKDNSTT
ncbi:MAG: hypothetical protein P9L92_06220 [Candidatus Electryonea clarkiae]|nr:hypothetical protein [Candidatus Electryonea clarkiae]MDP8287056.1 hypothetical protein [Candidatus Electryonea clarkiae]